MKVVGLSDEFGGIYNPDGFDPDGVSQHLRRNGRLAKASGSTEISNGALLELDVDVLIPAAIENQITARNADNIKAKLIAEFANGPTTPEADEILNRKGVYIIPDFLCNAGGVIVSYFEMVQNSYLYYWPEAEVNQRLDEKMSQAFNAVHTMAQEMEVSNRVAAYLVAVERVAQAVRLRGWI